MAYKMLAVFNKSISSAVPEELRSNEHNIQDSKPVESFLKSNHDAIHIKLGESASMAYTHSNESFFTPRAFRAKDGYFCLFVGALENLVNLRQQYGLSKTANEVTVVIEAYKTLKDRAPYPASKMVGHLDGQFAFVVFDSRTSTAFAACDFRGKAKLYWGITIDGSLALSDIVEVLQPACGKAIAQFPPGCYFCSTKGLQSYAYPKHKVQAFTHMDGDLYGTTFRIMEASPHETV